MDAAVKNLRNLIKGDVILPEDVIYNDARKIYNGMIDKHPAIILKCMDVDDVIAGVNYARNNKMEVAVKSGDHNAAGLSLLDNGLVIDLSAMNAIQTNTDEKTAKVQSVSNLAELDKAVDEHGLALPTG